MGGPKFACDLGVIFRAGVFVPNCNRDRSAEGSPFENTGQNLAPVFFFSLRGEFALTRATAIQLSLNIRFRNVDARRAAVDHNADDAAMRLTKGGDAKKLAECIAHLNQKSKRDPSDL